MNTLFGERLKLVLLFLSILSFMAYLNHVDHFGYAIISGFLLFSAIYLSVHEKK